MKLKTESGPDVAVLNWEELRHVLAGLHDNGNSFAILEKPDGTFLQTAVTDKGRVVERNEGSLERHFVASRGGSQDLQPSDADAIFRAYYEGLPMPFGIQWETQAVRTMPRWVAWLLWILPWAAGAFLLYQMVDSSVDLWKWISG